MFIDHLIPSTTKCHLCLSIPSTYHIFPFASFLDATFFPLLIPRYHLFYFIPLDTIFSLNPLENTFFMHPPPCTTFHPPLTPDSTFILPLPVLDDIHSPPPTPKSTFFLSIPQDNTHRHILPFS